MFIYGFAPVFTQEVKILILGSVPSVTSLENYEYYGYPRNQFWSIMDTILDDSDISSYEKKLETMINNKIALWDVIKSCYRKTSSDAMITNEKVNNFLWLFKTCPNIKSIYFNGAKAYDSFKRYVDKDLYMDKELIKLPSTSPANTHKLEKKIAEWKRIKKR